MAWRKKKKETERPHKLFPIQNYIALPPYTNMQRVHYRHLPSSQDATQIKVVLCHCEPYVYFYIRSVSKRDIIHQTPQGR